MLASGFAIDDILDMSFEQIKTVATCILRHKVFMINTVAEPLSEALGGGKKKKSKKPNNSAFKNLSPEQKDAIKLAQLNSLGFNVK